MPVCARSLSRVRLSVTPWTVAHQAPLTMGILQARILESVAISYSRDLPKPGIEPRSLASPPLADGFFTTAPPRKPERSIV